MSNCLIALQIVHRCVVSIEEYLCMVNMAYMVKLGQLSKNDQIRVNKAKCE